MVPTLSYLLSGVLATLALSTACIAASLVVGVALGILAAVGPRFLLSLIAGAVFLVRGIPVLVQVFLVFYGLPLIDVHLSATAVVFIAVSAHAAVLIAEIVRGAFAALPPSQTDAARALGMRRSAIVWHVLLPQALRYAAPPCISIMPVTIKATSFGSLIGVTELSTASHEMAAKTLAVLPIFGVTFGLYFLLCFPVSYLASRSERYFLGTLPGSVRQPIG